MGNFLRRESVPILYRVTHGGFIEGGDTMPGGHRAYFVGTGNRSNIAGARQLMDADAIGTDTVVVVKHPRDGVMQQIHLDCYATVVSDTHFLMWDRAAKLPVDVYRRAPATTRYVRVARDVPFAECVSELGWELIFVSSKCQREYGCNLLLLGDGRMITQNDECTAKLRAKGYRPIQILYDEPNAAYGGLHCTSQVLART